MRILPLSIGMLTTLDYIATHEVHVQHLKQLDQIVIYWLARREKHGYIQRKGTRISLTPRGEEIRELYHAKDPKWRANLSLPDVTDRVRDILALSTLSTMRKTA